MDKLNYIKAICASTMSAGSSNGMHVSEEGNAENNRITEEALMIYEHCLKESIGLLIPEDPLYPELLRHISDPPALLYYRGEIKHGSKNVAVVGSRKASPYGLKCTEHFASALAENGIVVISGLAAGIDARAHIAALDSGGITYAVLGNGVDVEYPKENSALYKKIIAHGAILSEYPPNRKPEKWHFPQRNRIISGMSYAVLVAEGSLKSGSMITAGHAALQGREVFCIPGNIFSANSAGSNRLISDGARLVSEPLEIIDYVRGLAY